MYVCARLSCCVPNRFLHTLLYWYVLRSQTCLPRWEWSYCQDSRGHHEGVLRAETIYGIFTRLMCEPFPETTGRSILKGHRPKKLPYPKASLEARSCRCCRTPELLVMILGIPQNTRRHDPNPPVLLVFRLGSV